MAGVALAPKDQSRWNADLDRRLRFGATGVVGIVLSVVLGAIVAAGVERQNAEILRERVDVVAKRFKETLEKRLLIFEYGLRGARGAVIAGGGDNATYDQFRRYIETRDVDREFPGAGGFGFIRPVKPQNMARFVDRVRREGQPEFRITEVEPHGGERYIVEYIESKYNEREAVGLDIASEPNRRAAAVAAVETGRATITAPISLVSMRPPVSDGFLILLPVFRSGDPIDTPAQRWRALIGWVHTVIDINDVLTRFDTIIGDFGFAITDGVGAGPFYFTEPIPATTSRVPIRDMTIQIYGRSWLIHLWTLPSFVNSMNLPDPLLAFAFALAFSLLLTAVVYLQMIYRSRRREYDIERSRLAAIVEGSNDAIISKALDGTITYWNCAAERLFGYSAAFAVGRKASELIVPTHLLGEEQRLIAEAREGGVVTNFRTQRRTSDGRLVDVAVSFSRIWNDSGAVAGIASAARNITDLVNAENEVRELNACLEMQVAQRTEELQKTGTLQTAIVKRAAYSIIATDTAGTITLFNPAAERMLGYDAKELVGRESCLLFHDPDELRQRAEAICPDGVTNVSDFGVILSILEKSDPSTSTWTYIDKDGNRIPVRLTLSSLRSDSFGDLGVLGIAVDLTEQLKYENELKAARASAEHASAAKADFLANMSHEIRTPLNGIIGYADLALEDQRLTLDTRRQLSRIFEASNSLRVIIDDILDFSKIEACGVKLECKPLYINELIDNCASIIEPKADEKGLELIAAAHDTPPVLIGDAVRLRQVILNLMNNAVKFTAAGKVELTVSSLSHSDTTARLRIAVTDTGIGISQDEQKLLFKRFSQADETISRKYGGTGLGLAISQRIVQAMGSELKIDSLPGIGSTFYFDLDLPIAGQIDIEQHDGPVHSSRCARVLVVDDVEMNRELCKTMLTRDGHEVDLAENGGTAITMAGGRSYDMIFMDIQMGEMDGMEAARRIRGLGGALQNVPIIALTANVLPEQVARYKAAGMDDHLGKPINRVELLACVARWTGVDRESTEAHATPATAAASDTPVCDPAALEELRMFASEADIAGFTDQLCSAVTNIRTQWPCGVEAPVPGEDPCEQLRLIAHKTISLAGQLGFTRLAEACRRMESACLGHADVPKAFDALQSAIESTVPELESLREVA
ncbi:MAG: PAS domain S-box protein [Rhodopseudomonas palustris]|uniref:histidine kinase n=1 Tax=Rhodopseudomonas palustris TaxID=1076 RepID=A0A933W0D8_RHOPL|nr:PAS domain S-box protein [Rhodopseudomonas palustris]